MILGFQHSVNEVCCSYGVLHSNDWYSVGW